MQGGLLGTYFDNQWFYGSPSFERIDPSISFNWSTGLVTPFSSDFVSISWHGKLRVDKSAIYTFYVIADDTVTVDLNHAVLIAAVDYCCVEFRAELYLIEGVFYDLVIKYVEITGSASVLLEYSSNAIKRQIIPQENLNYSQNIANSPFNTTVIPGIADFPNTTAFDGLSHVTAGSEALIYIQIKDSSVIIIIGF
jgi:hypothetical protein